VPFDIHGGGLDLIFPHHENEIAQSCCAHGLDRMANYWLHNGFVEMRGEKMAKSVGNVLRLDEALAIVPGEAIRWWMLGTHYRQPIDCSEDALQEAKKTLDRFYGALERSESVPDDTDEVAVDSLADDLNTPAAQSILHSLLSEANRGKNGAAGRLRYAGALLGFFGKEPIRWLRATDRVTLSVVEHAAVKKILGEDAIERLIAERKAARASRNFAEADRIRAELATEGIILEDTPTGTTWRRA
jgi:cysteinyl-tRNA synthetase